MDTEQTAGPRIYASPSLEGRARLLGPHYTAGDFGSEATNFSDSNNDLCA